MAHLVRFRSRYAHSEILCSLLICSCMFNKLFVMMTRSSTYIVVLHVAVEVLEWYPRLSFSNHCRSGV